MIAITIDVDAGKVLASLAKIDANTERKALARLFTQAQRTLTKAQTYTPVKTGALRASGRVELDGKTITISFGGVTASYAPYVHEILHYVHPIGQAKFLERAVIEDRAKFAEALKGLTR